MPKAKGSGDDARPALPASSYVILGLVARHGPMTPYEMKRYVAGGIGYFWNFPHSQLYVDPPRLVERGLLVESREDGGRRRRQFSISEAGRATLLEWLREVDDAPTEIHDQGLLKLYFGGLVSEADVVALAQGHAKAHAARVVEFEQIDARLAGADERAHTRATLRMGLLFERAAVAFWSEIAREPPPR